VGSGRLEPGIHGVGGESEAFLSSPQTIEALAVELDIERELELHSFERRNGQSVEVTREIASTHLSIAPLGGFEIRIEGEKHLFSRGGSGDCLGTSEDEIPDEPYPGSLIRCLYVPVGKAQYVRLSLMVEERSQHSVERLWREACERLWVGPGGE
jgi:hypothetical protein